METVQAVYELGTAGSTLDLSALGSTSGSNAFSSPPYEDTWDTVTAYEWDLNGDAHFEWGCRSEGSWGVDRVGADQQLDDSDLEALGMAVPGNQPIWLRVTDEQGTKHCSRSLVTIADGVSPQATMFLPDGGESWPFSESDSKRRRQFIVWDADDDFYLAHSKLSYSCDGGSNWTCIAESAWRYANLRGGVPIPDAPYESTWASSNIFVDWGMSGELVADVNVLVNINHPNVGDLNLVLEHVLPGGTTKSVPLSIYNGASGDNYEGTLFDDEAGSAIEAGAAPFTGSFRPQAGATLSEFDGVSPAGSWTLKVMDPVSGNAGAIGTWALQIATDSVCGSQNYSATDTLEADDDFFVWDLPTQKEAAESIPGQTFPSANCRARVEVWDGAGHTASDDSDANFYIVQPTTTSVRTLVLWHPERMCALYDATPGCDCEDWGGTSCTVTQNLEEKLGELADHDKVEGVVLDLGNSTAVATAYAAWDASPTDQTLANAVAAAIRTYLYGANGQISKTYTKTENLILVGDDAILPFYRMADGTMTTDPFDPAQDYSEAKYAGAAPNHEVAIDTTTTVGSALAQGYFLTDNYYSESFPEDSGLDAPHDKIYQNDYATGRLVETPAQVATVIDAFLAYSGQVDVLSSADEVLVTGFDFVFDSARTIYDLYEDVNYSPWTTDALLDDPDDLDPLDAPFTPANLLDQLIPAASTDLHKISSVNTHANHFSWAASAAGSGSANLLCTDPSYDAAYCYQGEGLDGRAGNLNATILYTSGCHSGLPIPNGAAGSSPYALDLPEVMAKKGVLAYIGNTGYGWAIRNGVGLTEKLMELITEEILKNSSVEIGRALAQAKREYFLQENRYDVFDEKVMHQLTLYGIPSTLLLIKNARGAKETLPPMSDPRDGCADGICVKKEDGAAGLRALPDGITEKRLTFTFGSGTYALTETSNGDYYTLNGLASGETGDAIQPKFIYDSYLSGTTAHGVLFTGGAYGSENFTPLSAVPKSTNDPNAGAGPLPAIGGFTPTLQGTDTRSSTTTMRSGSDGDYLNMVTHTGYFDPAAGEENRFDEMQFTVYYHQDIAGQVKAYSGNPVLIPDGGTATASITVSTSGIAKLEKVVVKVSVAHDGVGDLTLTLVSPASTEVALCSGVGGTDDHYSDTVFDDGAATPIGSGTAPFTGYFRPANPLSALAGESADGTWTLRVADGGPNGTGQILAFSLVFGYTAPVITEPDAPAPYASAGATAIVAGTAVTSDLTVSGSGIACIEDIDVTVDITHPFTADLTLSLVAPDASEIVLAQGLGAGADYTDTVFDDEAAAAVTGGANPFTGSFRPEQPLSRYDCTPADGTWSLKVADGGAAGGSLESWSIEFGEGLHTLEGLTARFSVAASDTNDIYRVLVTYDDLSGTWNSLDLSKNATSGAWEGSLDLQNDILYYVQAVDKVGKVGKLTEAGTDANSAGTKYGSTWAYTRLMELNLRDFDGDSLPDAYEDQHACLDGGTPGQGALDPDYDGLTSLEEMALGTDPCLADSDGDGDNDGSEENNGKEPLSAGDGDRLLIAPFKAGGTGNVTIRWPRATDNGTPTGNPCSPVDPPACVAVGDNNAMDGHFRVYVSTDPRFSTDDTKVGPLVPIDTRETTLTDPGETVYFIVTNWDILIPAPLIEVVTRNASVFTLYGQHFHAAGSQALLCEAADACNSPVQMTVTSRTTTRIQATAPGGLSGTKYVAVENPDGLRDIYGVGYSFP